VGQTTATAEHQTVRLDAERIRRLKAVAEAEDRSMASVLRRAVDRELARLEELDEAA
jgi:predicted transcriptional regulator